MSTNNPFTVGERVRVKRGDGTLSGTVVKTVLARVHVQLDGIDDEPGKIVVDRYHDVRQGDSFADAWDENPPAEFHTGGQTNDR